MPFDRDTQLGQVSENFGYSRARLKRLRKVQFGVCDPDEVS